MVLLNHVVEIASRPHVDALPTAIFVAEQSQAAMSRAVSVDVYLMRPRHAALANRRAEKRLRRFHAAIIAEQRRYRFSAPIHGAIQVMTATANRHRRLVHAPR